ncbi:hypothetical protein [Domibacillus tundrae]|uniref:hypothetical protein n=1 Tax=Domibacillus tundrae TaxID=1587527 RepID=UPI00061806B1|nr:hypothetical protein [Domibacillus tundrae]
MKLQLWLDESGDFQDTLNNKRNPSLVGGILIKENKIDHETARNLLGKSYVHFLEEQSEYTLHILEEIEAREGQFVIFQNTERLMVVDGDTTYLNVLAEGIIQLLLKLSATYGNFELSICIALRKNVGKGHGVIGEEQYVQRLKERVIVGLARKALTRKSNWKYHIQFDDARTNCQLMLADAVCNTYLTRTSSKFSPRQKEMISRLYHKEYIFSFYENSSEKEIQRWLAEGNFSEALFEILTNRYVENRASYLELTLNRLKELDDHSIKVQLQKISTKIDTLIKIDRNYHFTKPILLEIQEDLLPKLAENHILAPEFTLDVILYLYTLYTHEGSVYGNKQDQLFLEHINDVEDIMTKMKYLNMYKIRRGVHQKNMLNILPSIHDLTQAINLYEEMIGMMEILEDVQSNAISKYEILGKAYGTRGQGHTMLISSDHSNLPLAIKDFDHALQHFGTDRDRERQYIYKSLAYCEGNQFEEALYQLFLSSNISHNKMSLEEFLETLKAQDTSKVIFKYYCYIKIMATAEKEKSQILADQMYKAMNSTGITCEWIEKKYSYHHPLQYIYWFMGTYLHKRGKKNLAKRYIDQAIKILEDLPMTQLTLKVMQLGILAEKALITKPEKTKVQLINLYEKIMREQNGAMASYLQILHGKTAETLTNEDLQLLVKLTKCIN